MKSATNAGRAELYYALLFGLFLGLAIWKFGNPVILDNKVAPRRPPSVISGTITWPAALVPTGFWLPFVRGRPLPGILRRKPRSARRRAGSGSLPLAVVRLATGFGNAHLGCRPLTATTLWQFAGCVACYFIGALVLGRERALRWLLAGVLMAFTFCLVRAVDQRVFEFPESRRMLVGRRTDGLDQFPAGNASGNETRWHRHHHQRLGRGQSRDPRPASPGTA